VNKKIVIACLCSILILITPLVVSKENKITIDIIEESIIVEPNVDDVEELVVQLRIVINEILQKYGHITKIRTQCNKIIDILDSFGLIVYCVYLLILIIFLIVLYFTLYFLGFDFMELFWRFYVNFYKFEEYCLSSGSKLPLQSLSNINRIVASDSFTLTRLDDESNLVSRCPCMQQ